MDDSARISALELRVADLERKLNFCMQQLNLSYTAEPLSPAQKAAADWLRQGNKIEAVKAYLKLAGGGLKEARDAVDGLQAKLNAG